MNNYPLENLTWQEFEKLVILLCQHLLGIGAKAFADGKDKGRDSWFKGKADKYPSEKGPWTGVFIIQAKHTSESSASCSDASFESESNKASIITKELARLKEIKADEFFDSYLLFTNRSLTGFQQTPLVTRIQNELAITNVDVIGKEQINLYLDTYDYIPQMLGISKFQYPLRFFEKDIKEVINAFAGSKNNIKIEIEEELEKFKVISKEEKNRLNKLNKDYFDIIIKKSIQYFDSIESFLKDPINTTHLKSYENTVDDLRAQIVIHRNRFEGFETVLEHLINYIVSNNFESLKDNRSLVRVFVHYMYFNCEIGITE